MACCIRWMAASVCPHELSDETGAVASAATGIPCLASAAFNDANRAKRGIAIDLTREEGREVLRRLVTSADVLVENYRGDVMRNWGISFERVREWNPRILYYSSQGFGLGGPDEAHSIMGPNISPAICPNLSTRPPPVIRPRLPALALWISRKPLRRPAPR